MRINQYLLLSAAFFAAVVLRGPHVDAQLATLTDVCKGLADGSLVVAPECNQYYRCGVDGSATLETCQDGQAFNDLGFCAPMENVTCNANMTRGFWKQLMPSAGLVTIHCTLMVNSSNVAVWHRGQANWALVPQDGTANPENPKFEYLSVMVDPVNNQYQAYEAGPPFCGGHGHLPNGELLNCGGDFEDMSNRLGDPKGGIWRCQLFSCQDPNNITSCAWSDVGFMLDKRWYPGFVLLPEYNPRDGPFAIVQGGAMNGQDPVNWTEVNQNIDIVFPYHPNQTMHRHVPTNFSRKMGNMNMYPLMYLMPWTVNNQYVVFQWAINYGELIAVANPMTAPNETFSVLRQLPEVQSAEGNGNITLTYPSGACSVLHALEHPWTNARITVFGGNPGTFNEFNDLKDAINAETLGANQSFSINLGPDYPDSEWEAEWMPDHATMRTCLLLPTGRVLLIQGVRKGKQSSTVNGDGCSKEQLWQSWMYDPRLPAGERYQFDSTNELTYRAYHGCGLVMPDGSIFSGGGDTAPVEPGVSLCNGARDMKYSVDGYIPPAVYASMAANNRPAILESPDAIPLGSRFWVHFVNKVDECSLHQPGSRTHLVDSDSRVVILQTLQISVVKPDLEGWIRLQMPSSEAAIRRGRVLLYCLWRRRTYSAGKWVTILPNPEGMEGGSTLTNQGR